MNRFRIGMGVIGMALLAGQGTAVAETVTLQEIYSRVREKNEEILMARQTVRQSEEDKNLARSSLLPKITLSGSYTHYPEETVNLGGSVIQLQPDKHYGLEATIEQPLFAGGSNMANLRKARRQLEVSRKDFSLSTEQLLLRAAETFYGVLKAQKNLEAQQRNVDRLTEHRRISELRYQVGEVTRTVLLRAEAELAAAQAELVASENALAVNRKSLRNLADLGDDFELQDPPLPEAPSVSEADLLETALSMRDDVRVSMLQEKMAEDGVSAARGQFLPKITLQGTYFRRNEDPRSTFFIDESWFVGGVAELPLFAGGANKAAFSRARSQLDQSRLAAYKLKKDVDLDVTTSNLTLKAVTRVLESRKDALRFASENYALVSKQFTFGVATNTDLLDANQTLIEAERDMIAATYDQHLAILNLQRSAGLFMKSAVGEDADSM